MKNRLIWPKTVHYNQNLVLVRKIEFQCKEIIWNLFFKLYYRFLSSNRRSYKRDLESGLSELPIIIHNRPRQVQMVGTKRDNSIKVCNWGQWWMTLYWLFWSNLFFNLVRSIVGSSMEGAINPYSQILENLSRNFSNIFFRVMTRAVYLENLSILCSKFQFWGRELDRLPGKLIH